MGKHKSDQKSQTNLKQAPEVPKAGTNEQNQYR